MRLTVHTDYALRVLMYLAVHPEPMPTIAEIAASYGISRNHLMKVVYGLGLAGFVETVRGKHGGLRLAKPASAITVGEVVRATEPDLTLVPCFDAGNAPCAVLPACRLKGVLHRARAAFLAVLDEATLEEVVGDRQLLDALLQRRVSQPDVSQPHVSQHLASHKEAS